MSYTTTSDGVVGELSSSITTAIGTSLASAGLAGTPDTHESGDASVVNGADNTKGAWAELIDATTVAIKEIIVVINNVISVGTYTPHVVDIGVGAAGSEAVIIPDIKIAGANASLDGTSTIVLKFEHEIPSGSRIAARGQTNHSATIAGNIQVIVGGS